MLKWGAACSQLIQFVWHLPHQVLTLMDQQPMAQVMQRMRQTETVCACQSWPYTLVYCGALRLLHSVRGPVLRYPHWGTEAIWCSTMWCGPVCVQVCSRLNISDLCIGTYHTLSRAQLHFGPCYWSIFLNVYLKEFFFFILAKVGQWKE